jgi:hypothetical protein
MHPLDALILSLPTRSWLLASQGATSSPQVKARQGSRQAIISPYARNFVRLRQVRRYPEGTLTLQKSERESLRDPSAPAAHGPPLTAWFIEMIRYLTSHSTQIWGCTLANHDIKAQDLTNITLENQSPDITAYECERAENVFPMSSQSPILEVLKDKLEWQGPPPSNMAFSVNKIRVIGIRMKRPITITPRYNKKRQYITKSTQRLY